MKMIKIKCAVILPGSQQPSAIILNELPIICCVSEWLHILVQEPGHPLREASTFSN